MSEFIGYGVFEDDDESVYVETCSLSSVRVFIERSSFFFFN